MYDWLYRWRLTPWVMAGRLQSGLVHKLLSTEEHWHGDKRRLLDIGCGSGEHSVAAALRGWSVFGVDASPIAIQRARQAATQAGVDANFAVGDVRQLTEIAGIPDQIDLFVDVGCYHGLDRADRRLVAAGIKRLAAPQASMLVVGLARAPKLTRVGLTAEGLAADFADWTITALDAFSLGVPGLLRRARFRVFRLTKEDQ